MDGYGVKVFKQRVFRNIHIERRMWKMRWETPREKSGSEYLAWLSFCLHRDFFAIFAIAYKEAVVTPGYFESKI